MVALHARHPDFRYIYNSNHKLKDDKFEWLGKEERKQINKAWKLFWKRRGRVSPPRVGKKHYGDFDI